MTNLYEPLQSRIEVLISRPLQPQTTEEYARILYASLRDADSQKLSRICIDQPQGDGLAIAICDRLQRAARGR